LTLGLHCNLQFSVAASSRRICDVFSVNLRLQFPFNNNNNNYYYNTINLATETYINAISVSILCFGNKIFTGVHANLSRCFLHSETPRWLTDTGISYNFATKNDIIVISTATT